jgi:serine/threonine-protein kinase
MGEVYRGRRIDDGRAVAVKVLHPYLADRKGMRERFQREALLLGRISAAHVAKVIECGATADGQEFIVMEHLAGEDLGTRLKRRASFPLAELVSLVDRIALALEAAHAAGVVHRDLKPENVFLLEGTDDVRLLDFGIARFQEGDGLTMTMELLGTPGYMAPEQVRGERREIGPHTDVFALGAIVYRALTGESAFPSRAPASAVYEALHLTPRPPSSVNPDLPEDVDHVLALALAKNSTDRYGTPLRFVRELRMAMEGSLDEATRVSARKLAPGDTVDQVRPASGRGIERSSAAAH